jgi:hypothetical protein
MREPMVRGAGLMAALAYAAAIAWLYVTQPQTVAQMTGGLASVVGAYHIDQQAFDDGLRFFRAGQFEEARAALARADAAERDARTQFYIAYTFYRQGWGRVYNDDALFAKGLAAVDKAIALAPAGRLVVDDADLQMRSADELRAELQRGLTREPSDFNPLKVFRTRK